MKRITALAPWYGSSRIIAPHVGRLLKGLKWIGVPFVGGFCEVPHFDARTIVVNDVHRHVINLARVVADPALVGPLMQRLDPHTVFSPDQLAESQRHCIAADLADSTSDPEAAYHYFVCSWMGRNGKAGTAGEFKSGFSMRWEAGGGDSCVRFRNATAALKDWHAVMRRCTFTTLDCFKFLDSCKDHADHGIYCDPPWPSDGYLYAHTFSEAQQVRLAEDLLRFRRTRVVVRFGDHPLIRKLYPESDWEWLAVSGRTASNKEKAEVLLVRRRQSDADLCGEAAPRA
jgi:DNA adenine methylase